MVWIKPAVGLFFGVGENGTNSNVSGNPDKEKKASGGLVLGDWLVQIGLLLGMNIGIGKKFGIFTGLLGGLALIPLLGFGFVGIPIGVHYKQRIGIGLIFPIFDVHPLVALVVGVALFYISLKWKKSK